MNAEAEFPAKLRKIEALYAGAATPGDKARGHRDLVTTTGHAAIISGGEWITATGEWVNDRTHGLQFKARFLSRLRLRHTRHRLSHCRLHR